MSIKPKNFGVIVRTVAEGKRVAELDGELRVLIKHWEDAMVKVQKATKYPTLIYEETSRAVGLLRDLFNPSFENIHVNDEAVYNEIKDYVNINCARPGQYRKNCTKANFPFTTISVSPNRLNHRLVKQSLTRVVPI